MPSLISYSLIKNSFISCKDTKKMECVSNVKRIKNRRTMNSAALKADLITAIIALIF